MIITVRHMAIKDNYKRGRELGKLAKDELKSGKIVAIMNLAGDTNSILNEAYRLTNSIDTAWYESKDERVSISEDAAKGCRSTSIGDVIRICDVDYMVDSFGFLCLDDL